MSSIFYAETCVRPLFHASAHTEIVLQSNVLHSTEYSKPRLFNIHRCVLTEGIKNDTTMLSQNLQMPRYKFLHPFMTEELTWWRLCSNY